MRGSLMRASSRTPGAISLAGLGLGDVASGQRGKQESRKQQSSYLVSGHVAFVGAWLNNPLTIAICQRTSSQKGRSWQAGFTRETDCPPMDLPEIAQLCHSEIATRFPKIAAAFAPQIPAGPPPMTTEVKMLCHTASACLTPNGQACRRPASGELEKGVVPRR